MSTKGKLEVVEYCDCTIKIMGKRDELKVKGYRNLDVSGQHCSYKNWQTVERKLSGLVVCRENYVVEAFRHIEVCPTAKKRSSDLWLAYYNAAKSKPAGISQTMWRALKRASRKIDEPEVNAIISMIEVHSN